MGKKGSKLTSDADAAAASLVAELAELGEVSHRKMFGGVGIFESGTMFGIIDSRGRAFFRSGEANAALFEKAGSERHGKMPYYSVPESVLNDSAELSAWGTAAIESSRSEKK